MPASITTDFVVSRPKVAGSRMLMPERGPIPGNTPTTVPTTHPRKAYQRTSGCSATEKPSSRLSSVDISEAECTSLQRSAEHQVEQQIRQCHHCQAEQRRARRRTPLHRKRQHKQHQRHRYEETQGEIERDRGGGGGDYARRMRQVVPFDAGERRAVLGAQKKDAAEEREQHGDELRHHAGAGKRKAAGGKVSA